MNGFGGMILCLILYGSGYPINNGEYGKPQTSDPSDSKNTAQFLPPLVSLQSDAVCFLAPTAPSFSIVTSTLNPPLRSLQPLLYQISCNHSQLRLIGLSKPAPPKAPSKK